MRFPPPRLRPLVPLVALLLLVLAGPVLPARAGEPAAGGIPWIEDWGTALARAKKEGRPLLVDFHTSWCAFCYKLERESFGDPGVARLLRDHFVCARLDAEVQKAATLRYRPEGFPTVIFAAPDGEEITRFAGFRTAAQVREIVEKVIAAAPRVAELSARVRRERRAPEPLLELGKVYLELGAGDRAASLFRRAARLLPRDDPARQAEAMLLLARAEHVAGDDAAARKTLRKLLRRYPGTPASGAARRELDRLG